MEKKDKKIVVINRLKTSRAITIKTLKNLGYQDFKEISDLMHPPNEKFFMDSPYIILEVSNLKRLVDELKWLQSIRSKPALKDLEVVTTFTGEKIHKDIVMKFVSLGVKDFVLKNNNLSVFSEKINIALENKLRKHLRLKLNTPFDAYSLKTDEEPEKEWGKVLDVTIGGFLLLSKETFEAPNQYTLNFKLPGEVLDKKELSVKAICRNVKADQEGTSKVGFQIVELPEGDLLVIEELIRQYCSLG